MAKDDNRFKSSIELIMLVLKSEITIGNLRFDYVTNVSINSSWETLTDTAVIELPTNITNQDNEFIKDKINVNDEVTIKIGYAPNLTTRFVGYVSKIIPESPLKIMCEDEAFVLKQKTINNYSKDNVTLETLISDNYEGEAVVSDANLGSWRIDRVTLVKVLQELRNKYKLRSWFRDGILYSGLTNIQGQGTTHEFSFQRTIIDGSDLQATDENELNTIAHGISEHPDGKNIELYSYYKTGTTGEIVTAEGDPGGDLNTIKVPKITKERLQEILERWLPNLYYTGFKGTFETFGEPVVLHGDIVKLEDLKFPEKDGSYLVKSVSVMFGQGGYKQVIEPFRSV